MEWMINYQIFFTIILYKIYNKEEEKKHNKLFIKIFNNQINIMNSLIYNLFNLLI
jgi:hypothetical protein